MVFLIFPTMAFAKRSPSSSQGNVGPGVAAVPLEDVFRDYFDALGHYDHVGAHRVLRVHAGALQGSAFPNVHATLTKLVQCEMLYCSLADLKQKWFRKDVRFWLAYWVRFGLTMTSICPVAFGDV